MKVIQKAGTGIPGLDEVVDSLRLGDNVVWRVDDIEEYRYIVQAFVNQAIAEEKNIIYLRFAKHPPLLDSHPSVKVFNLDAESGFESFSMQIHTIVKQEGVGSYYVFDCLSDLLAAWASDLMVGNFFVITCPYLFELDTIAYFAIIRGRLSFQTVARIRETTQLLIDIYHDQDNFYIHPLKVWKRYSPTMFLPHLQEGERFTPIINSVDAAMLFSELSQRKIQRSQRELDYWDRLFLRAEDLLDSLSKYEERQEMLDELFRIMITRDPRMLALVKEHTTLDDLISLRNKLIGTGFIGGKGVGMLLARKILINDDSFKWRAWLEPHDSFYVGSDVFYTYLVQNGWWKLRVEQKTKEGYFTTAAALREKMLKGVFPDEIKEQFYRMIEYFGQSPIIVRSSSLLEDSFGNAFAGKYESIFLVNQGSPEERYTSFENAVRRIFASAFNEDALIYRRQRGLEDADEQMALLVQRVSGSYHKHYFFPDIGGVGVSYNAFVWKKEMRPEAGMLRLVMGLGTRAVDRVEGDYPRIVALDSPLLRPLAGMDDIRKFTQHNLDLIDVEENLLKTIPLLKLMGQKTDVKIERIALMDHETNQRLRELNIKDEEAWIITFDEFLSTTEFPRLMQRMLKKLETVYQYPVDIEFTVNFTKEDSFRINLLQCRPLEILGEEKTVKFPEEVASGKIFFQFEGNFFGGSIAQSLRRLIVIDPKAYVALPVQKKYEVARLVGRLNRQIRSKAELPTMMLGPGRWGTTTPSLGVPVSFSEINHMTVLGEIAYAEGNLMPELSYGSHFFQDLVETGIFYVAIFPDEKGIVFNREFIQQMPNLLDRLLPDSESYMNVVKVCDFPQADVHILADLISQKLLCYRQ